MCDCGHDLAAHRGDGVCLGCGCEITLVNIQKIIKFVRTLNDLYGWNDWVCERIADRFT